MSDRLAELRRQRALIQEHLNWLDREIAATEKSTGATPTASAPTPLTPSPPAAAPVWPAPVSPASSPLRPPEPPLVISVPAPQPLPTSRLMPRSFGAAAQPALPSASLGEYRVSPGSVKDDVRKGCLLYFAAAFVLLFVGVGILWMIFRR